MRGTSAVTADTKVAGVQPPMWAVPDVSSCFCSFLSSCFKGKDKKLPGEKGHFISFCSLVPERIPWFRRVCTVGGTVIIFTRGNILFVILPLHPARVAANVTGCCCPPAVTYVLVFGAFSALQCFLSRAGGGGKEDTARSAASSPDHSPTYASRGSRMLLLLAAMSAAGGATGLDSQVLLGELQ